MIASPSLRASAPSSSSQGSAWISQRSSISNSLQMARARSTWKPVRRPELSRKLNGGKSVVVRKRNRDISLRSGFASRSLVSQNTGMLGCWALAGDRGRQRRREAEGAGNLVKRRLPERRRRPQGGAAHEVLANGRSKAMLCSAPEAGAGPHRSRCRRGAPARASAAIARNSLPARHSVVAGQSKICAYGSEKSFSQQAGGPDLRLWPGDREKLFPLDCELATGRRNL